jgi:hypothetical protein
MRKEDIARVASRVPKPLREYMEKSTKPLYLGGGFVRDVISGERPSDVDFFTDTMDNATYHAIQIAQVLKGKIIAKTENAETILSPGRIAVQVIKKWLFDHPEDVIKSFDFTFAQAVIWYDLRRKKWKGMCSADFYADVASKALVYTYPDRDEAPGGSMMRVRKFLRRGYKISAENLGGVISRLVSKIDEEAMEAFRESEEENTETIRTRIIISLLRSVDPLVNIDAEIVED